MYRKASQKSYDTKLGRRTKSPGSLRSATRKAREQSRPLRDEVKLWLADSDDSVKVARDNLALGNYHVTAFYTHQAVEKALKAAIIALKNKTAPKTHSLKLLHSEVADEIPLTGQQKDFLGELTPAAQVARYVDVAVGLPREIYSKRLVEEYLEKALPIIDATRKRIMEENWR